VSIKTIELYESGVLATSPFGAILRGSSLAVARRPGLVAVVVRIYRRLAHFAGRGRPALHRQLPGRLISPDGTDRLDPGHAKLKGGRLGNTQSTTGAHGLRHDYAAQSALSTLGSQKLELKTNDLQQIGTRVSCG